jgi:hypothetical protein
LHISSAQSLSGGVLIIALDLLAIPLASASYFYAVSVSTDEDNLDGNLHTGYEVDDIGPRILLPAKIGP